MKRIAIYSSNLSIGGIQRSLLNILTFLGHYPVQVDLYLLEKNSRFEKALPANVQLHQLRSTPKVAGLIPFSLAYQLHPNQRSAEGHYDLAIDFDGYQVATAAACLRADARRRVIWIHSALSERYEHNRRFKLMLDASSSKYLQFPEVVAVSAKAAISYREAVLKGIIRPARKQRRVISSEAAGQQICVIPNLIDTERIFQQAEEPWALPALIEDGYRLCFVGRLSEEKRLDGLLDLFNDVTGQRDDLHLFIIGDGSVRKALEQQRTELGLDTRVHFLGEQLNPYPILDAMDGLILVSRYEGQGMVVREAQALGLDIFLSANLAGTNEGIAVSKDLHSDLLTAVRKPKVRDDLSAYNEDIKKHLGQLFALQD